MLLRLGAAATMISFGINQLKQPELWYEYIPQGLRGFPSIAPHKIVRAHAIGNTIIGVILILGILPLAGAWLAFLWWLMILFFAFLHKWTLGMQEVGIAVSLLALIYLVS